MFVKNYLPYYKRNLKVAIPVMLSQAGQVLVQQVDNMMVGSLGTNELAAASFANALFIIGMVLGMGFTLGLTPLVGHAFGSKNHKGSANLLYNSSLTNSVIGIILCILMYSVSFFMDKMGQPDDVLRLAIPYYQILVYSMMPFMLFFTLKQFAEGIGNTMNAMIITLFANIVNVVINYVLIFGKFGFPQLGLVGAGIGTLISRVVMMILFIIIFVYRKQFRFYLNEALKENFNLKTIYQLINMGWPISIQIVLEVCAFVLGNIMMGWLGASSLAAHQVGIGLASITFMIVTGIGSGTTIRVSHQYSKKNYEGLSKAAYASIHLVIAFMTITAILFVILRNYLPLLYTTDPAVIAIASQLLIMAAAFQIFDGLQVVMLGILRGLSDVKYAMRVAFISYILISLPVSYLFAFTFNYGAIGVWVGLVVSLGIASIVFLYRFRNLYSRMIQK
jgi:MATE family multidrug resistance protein